MNRIANCESLSSDKSSDLFSDTLTKNKIKNQDIHGIKENRDYKLYQLKK